MNIAMTITQLFNDFKESAFRLETLPEYNVPDETLAREYFRANGTLPEGHNKEWLELISKNVSAGKTMKRLRLLTIPLTEYEQFEMAAYKGNIAAGEQIRFHKNKKLKPVQDFWAFDNTWIARMLYDDHGAWLGAEVSEMDEDDQRMVAAWVEIWESAQSIDEAGNW